MAEADTGTAAEPGDIDALQAEAEAKAAPEQENTPDPTEAAAEPVASLMGWKPLDQWKGDPTNWKPASAFLAEVPEINRSLRKKSERLEGQHARIIAEVAKLSANQRRQMDAETDKQLEAAFDAGDLETVKRLVAESRKAPEPQEPAAFSSFKDRNAEWFQIDPEATAYVLALDQQFNADGSGAANPDAHFRKIETAVKKRFPELFGEKSADPTPERKAPLVARGSRSEAIRNGAEMTAADLSPAQRQAARDMNVSAEAYVKELNRINAREKARA